MLHGFLTLALVHHMGESSPSIGDAIGDALYDWTDLGKGWEELKKNPEEFAEYVLSYLEQTGSAPINRDATKNVIVQAIQESAKVLDKIIPSVERLKHLKATSDAVSGAADDPSQNLRNAGIDIEPELEEFRQFLAEISGKKLPVPKFKQVQKKVKNASLEGTKLEVLSLFQTLKLLNYSEEAVNNAVKDLEKKIREITELYYPAPEDVYRLGLYYLALSYIRDGKFKKVEEVFRGL